MLAAEARTFLGRAGAASASLLTPVHAATDDLEFSEPIESARAGGARALCARCGTFCARRRAAHVMTQRTSDAELGNRDARLARIRGYGRPQAQPSLQSLVRCQANHRHGQGVCSPRTAGHDRRLPRYTRGKHDKHDKALLLCQRAHYMFP